MNAEGHHGHRPGEAGRVVVVCVPLKRYSVTVQHEDITVARASVMLDATEQKARVKTDKRAGKPDPARKKAVTIR